jgi:hypothetical protein
MATFVKINEENIVTDILKVSNDMEENGAEFLAERHGGRWIRTTFSADIRRNTAGIGMYYNEEEDCFENRFKPYASWIWDNTLKRYISPQPIPADGDPKSPEFDRKIYQWNEQTIQWDLVGELPLNAEMEDTI